MKNLMKNLILGVVATGVFYGIMWGLCNMVEWVCASEKRFAVVGVLGLIAVVKILTAEE